MVDGAPQVHPPAGNADHHLIEMPAIARSRALVSQLAGDVRAELQDPAPHRLVGQVETALGQKLLNIAVA